MIRPAKMRVLIVDDDGDLRMGLSGLLRAYGHDVEEADCCERALAQALASPPDAAIIDLELRSTLDGYDLARKLRESPITQHLRLVSLTGHRGPHERTRALAAGFDAHLVKPVTDSELFAALTAERP